jgi:hypothetical protein
VDIITGVKTTMAGPDPPQHCCIPGIRGVMRGHIIERHSRGKSNALLAARAVPHHSEHFSPEAAARSVGWHRAESGEGALVRLEVCPCGVLELLANVNQPRTGHQKFHLRVPTNPPMYFCSLAYKIMRVVRKPFTLACLRAFARTRTDHVAILVYAI